MSFGFEAFVLETASNPGTGTTVQLLGASTGRRALVTALGSGRTIPYYMSDGSQAEWGVATITAGTPNTLSRDTVKGNTSGTTSRLNFTGTVNVYVDLPPQLMVGLDNNGSLVDFAGNATHYAASVGGTGNAITATLARIVALAAGQHFLLKAANSNSGATALTLTGFGGSLGSKNVFRQTPAGPAAMVGGEILANQIVELVYDGTQFQLVSPSAAAPDLLAASVASASSPDIWAGNGNSLHITGTTTITGFAAAPLAGARRRIVFDGILTFTNGANLILPTGGNIATSAGDTCEVLAETTTQFRIVDYMRASGAALAGGVVQAAFKNLKITNGGTPNSQVAVTADQVALVDSGNGGFIASAVNLTVSTASTGANALDTGTVGASTWYSVWVIAKPDGTVAGLLSTSATAPTLPSGYTFKARVGWVRTDGSSNLLRTLQLGRRAQYLTTSVALPTLQSGSTGSISVPTYTSTSVNNFVPTTASRIALVMSVNTGSGVIIAAPSNTYGAYTSLTSPPPAAATANLGVSVSPAEFALESTNVFIASSAASGLVQVLGWEDNI